VALTPGSRLGPYEILEPIRLCRDCGGRVGVSGLGEFYRDAKLVRDVAIETVVSEQEETQGNYEGDVDPMVFCGLVYLKSIFNNTRS
jgi:hypothetical protein